MAVRFLSHARERLAERGATEDEVQATIERGERFVAKFGRSGFRRNFSFDRRRGSRYLLLRAKQVEVHAVREDDDWLVVTVLTRYF